MLDHVKLQKTKIKCNTFQILLLLMTTIVSRFTVLILFLTMFHCYLLKFKIKKLIITFPRESIFLKSRHLQNFEINALSNNLRLIFRMRSRRDKNNMIQKDFDVDMSLWGLESIGVVALGRRLNCLDPNLPEDSQERKLINCIHEVFQIIFDLDFMPSMSGIYATRKFKRAMKLYEEQEK